MAIGDFNRSPHTVAALAPPDDTRIYNPGQPTHASGGELDYMASNVFTERWQATVAPKTNSDHWPVHFGALLAAAGPRSFTIEAHNSRLLLNVDHALSINGTHVLHYHDDGGANSRWFLEPLGVRNTVGDHLAPAGERGHPHVPRRQHGQHSGVGDYLNMWDCHPADGEPGAGGYLHDTQDVTLDHPDPMFGEPDGAARQRHRSIRQYRLELLLRGRLGHPVPLPGGPRP